MPIINRWRWRILDPERGKRYSPRCHMSEADAFELDPTAERIEGSLQLLELPDRVEDMSTSAWQRRP